MPGPHNKTGAVGAAPESQSSANDSTGPTTLKYALPDEYRKPIRFNVDGLAVRLTGGRAYLLDLLAMAKPAAIDRSRTWGWCANLGDTVAALRQRGILIVTLPRPQSGYVLQCDVRRIGAQS
jgi:hypothetical protein